MSSMRNAVPRRSHKERPQPLSRGKRGLLEKKKDYVLRAQDYKKKQATLKRLTEKAIERNPDEFYFGMVREHTQGGVAVVDRPGSQNLSVNEVKPLKVQDVKYLRTMRNIERRNIERLRGAMATNGESKKILFAENEDEAEEIRLQPKEGIKLGGKSRAAKEIEARIAREAELSKMERQTTLQLQLMGKGKVRRIRRKDEDSDDDERVPIYKWRPQRQK